MSIQTQTPLSSLQALPDRQALLAAFKGQHIGQLRTPALLVNARTFERNCQRVTAEAQGRGMLFRAHIKSECLGRTSAMTGKGRLGRVSK